MHCKVVEEDEHMQEEADVFLGVCGNFKTELAEFSGAVDAHFDGLASLERNVADTAPGRSGEVARFRPWLGFWWRRFPPVQIRCVCCEVGACRDLEPLVVGLGHTPSGLTFRLTGMRQRFWVVLSRKGGWSRRQNRDAPSPRKTVGSGWWLCVPRPVGCHAGDQPPPCIQAFTLLWTWVLCIRSHALALSEISHSHPPSHHQACYSGVAFSDVARG